LFARVVEFLRELTTEHPAIIVLEDFHWADQASLDLLQHVALRIEHLRVLLVATYRDDEVTRGHLLFRYLPTLVRDSGATRIHLRRLDHAETDALVVRSYALPQHDRERLTSYVFSRSEGNPLFTGELLQSFEADATLRRAASEERWTLGDLSGRHVPPLVQQVIEARLVHLSPEARDIVNVAAVIGEDVPLDVLARVIGAGADAMPPGIDEAFDARVLVESGNTATLRFSHGLVREALLDGLSPLRRRGWHRRVAEALAESARPDPDAVAHHFQQAGDDRALLWLLRAGLRSERSYAFNMAAERYMSALELLGDDDHDMRRRGWLLFRIGNLMSLSDRVRSLAAFEEAAHIGNATSDRMLTAYAHGRFSLILTQIGDARASLSEVQMSVEEFDRLTSADLPADEELLALGFVPATMPRMNPLRGELVRAMAVAGGVTEALQVGEPFMEHADASSSDLTASMGIGEAWYGLGTAYAVLGRPNEARRAAAQSRAWFQRLGEYAWVNNAISLDLWIVLWYETDQIMERNRLVSDANASWQKAIGALSNESAEADTDFWTQLLDGRWDNVARQAPAGLAGHALVSWRMDAVNALSTLAVWRGAYQQASDLIASVLPDGPSVQVRTLPFVHTSRMLRIAACVARHNQDAPAMRAWLDAHDRWLRTTGSVLGRAEGSLLWSSYHKATGDRARALQAAKLALEQAEQPRQPHVLLLVHRAVGNLHRTEGRYAAAEEHLQSALGLAQTCGAPFERALTQVALAQLRIATGDHAGAQSLLASAQAVCETLGARPTLAHIDALSAQSTNAASSTKSAPFPVGLTAREVDVLRLIANGLTDAEAGAQLFISPRTISTHLTSIYSKIGVSSRYAAARFANEHGIV